jgi:hypothetical protein
MNIIKLAKQAGFADSAGVVHAAYQLETFAALVEAAARADEREACAKIAEIAEPYQAADLIRARGTT